MSAAFTSVRTWYSSSVGVPLLIWTTLFLWNMAKGFISAMVQCRAMVLSEQTILLTTQSSRDFCTVQPRLDPEHRAWSSFLGIVELGSANAGLDMSSWHDHPPPSNSKPMYTVIMRTSSAASTKTIILALEFAASSGIIALLKHNPRSSSSIQKFCIHLFLITSGMGSSQPRTILQVFLVSSLRPPIIGPKSPRKSNTEATLLTTSLRVRFLGTKFSKSPKVPVKIFTLESSLPLFTLPKCRGGIGTLTTSNCGNQ